MYDPATDTWTVLPSMPTARNHVAAGVVDGKLYVVGGRFGGGFDSELTNAPRPTTPRRVPGRRGPPRRRSARGCRPRSSATACICSVASATALTRAACFRRPKRSTRAADWYELTPMPTPMHGQIGAAVFDGRIHVAGAAVTYGGDSATVLHQVYTPELACD